MTKRAFAIKLESRTINQIRDLAEKMNLPPHTLARALLIKELSREVRNQEEHQ